MVRAALDSLLRGNDGFAPSFTYNNFTSIPYKSNKSKAEPWGFAPNPTREMISLDPHYLKTFYLYNSRKT